MLKAFAGPLLLISAAPAWAAASTTDFGVRAVTGEAALAAEPVSQATRAVTSVMTGGRINISAAASLGSHWGRVTSTWRSREHNRRVGGVRNSYHISGRAIDIARRPGVSHWQIAAAFRNAGYRLIESLDEGDHSHFAFGTGEGPVYRPLKQQQRQQAQQQQEQRTAPTQWRIVTAASAILK
ncbi:MAG TPA: D-Ala-D-Ala carboxypeptidase family metallohydrolase [Sphingomicrobium sp.]|jgi:hypothetical protein|nr:D-Ala-D-Ala carboxypeptidase family metallohydrolase [Sphingomicrobium sp.]